MADNLNYNNPVSGSTIATDDAGGAHYQRVKLVDGTLDSTAAIPGDATSGLYVQVKDSITLPTKPLSPAIYTYAFITDGSRIATLEMYDASGSTVAVKTLTPTATGTGARYLLNSGWSAAWVGAKVIALSGAGNIYFNNAGLNSAASVASSVTADAPTTGSDVLYVGQTLGLTIGQPVTVAGAIDINTGNSIAISSVTPGTTATSLGKAEDVAFAGADTGVSVFSVRDDALGGSEAWTVNAEGDYTVFRTNSRGALWTTGDVVRTAGSQGNIKASGLLTTTVNATGYLDVTAARFGVVQVDSSGAISTPGTLRLQLFNYVGTLADTVSFYDSGLIASGVGQAVAFSYRLDTGYYYYVVSANTSNFGAVRVTLDTYKT